jgi:hypothetical protein
VSKEKAWIFVLPFSPCLYIQCTADKEEKGRRGDGGVGKWGNKGLEEMGEQVTEGILE